VAWGLRGLAHAQRDAFLIHKAQSRIDLVSRGATPYRWELRASADLIAGRVFGARQIDFDERGLRVEAGAEAFEIGFPLNNDIIDLARFNRLRIRALAQAPLTRCELVLRQSLSDEERKAPLDLSARGESEEIPLSRLDWSDASGAHAPTPERAASLRLRILAPAGTLFHLDTLEFLPDPKLSDTRLLARSLAGAKRARPGLAVIGPATTSDALPIVGFSPSISNEAAMAYFDRLRQYEPSVQLVPQSSLDSLQPPASPPIPMPQMGAVESWLATLALGAALLALRLRPPQRPRLRAGLELIAVLAPALGIVTGGWLGNDLDGPIGSALVFVAAFALSLPRLQAWRWAGGWRAWSLPCLAVIAALVLAATLGDHLKLRGTLSLFRYLAWTALQQYLICFVIADRCRVMGLGKPWTVVLVAAVFALLHTPNETLMLATFAGGLVWTAAWLRDRCFLPVVASHALSAMIVFSTLPTHVLRSAEVSLRFLIS